MQRITQTLEGILGSLSRVETVWRDKESDKIEKELAYLEEILSRAPFNEELISILLHKDFKAYVTIFRLILESSKDEIEGSLRECFPKGIGQNAFKKNIPGFIKFFNDAGLIERVNEYLSKRWSWRDIIFERLKTGRGRAIKGQYRGRFLEKAVEAVIKEVFGNKYDKNCNFIGMHNQEAKAEFAIPNKENPSIIFEAKAYGATGSKQTVIF